jgi:hypothetical protein
MRYVRLAQRFLRLVASEFQSEQLIGSKDPDIRRRNHGELESGVQRTGGRPHLPNQLI